MGFNGDGVREGAHLHSSHRGQCQQNVAHTAPARVNCLHSVHMPPCVTLPYCHSVTHRSGQLQPVTRQWWTRWWATVAQCSIAGPDCGKFSGKMAIRSTYSGLEGRIGGSEDTFQCTMRRDNGSVASVRCSEDRGQRSLPRVSSDHLLMSASTPSSRPPHLLLALERKYLSKRKWTQKAFVVCWMFCPNWQQCLNVEARSAVWPREYQHSPGAENKQSPDCVWWVGVTGLSHAWWCPPPPLYMLITLNIQHKQHSSSLHVSSCLHRYWN